MIQIQKPHSVLSKNKPLKFLHFHTKKNISSLPLVFYSLKNNTLKKKQQEEGYSSMLLKSSILTTLKAHRSTLSRLLCHPQKKTAGRVQPFAPCSINLVHACALRMMKKKEYNNDRHPRGTMITRICESFTSLMPLRGKGGTGASYTINRLLKSEILNRCKKTKRVYSVLCKSSTIAPTSCRGNEARTVKKEYDLVGVYRKNTQKNTDYKQKISLKKRKAFKRMYPSKRKIKGILGKLYISSTKNNTILTLIDTNNNTKGWSCSGSLGFKNARKSTTYAAQAAAESMVKKAKILGYTHLRLLVKGLGRGKQSCLRALSKSGLKIISLEDRTGIPYNGCRASKKRRV
ncbi:hypothetical protein ABBQ38_015096 [Trebouxia sp. C0009 RCD-2024]